MDLTFQIVLIIFLSPLLILGFQIGLQRLARLLDWKLSAQIGAFIAIFCGFFVVAFAEYQRISNNMLFSSESTFCFLLYIVIVYLMIGFLYMTVINLSDTSLHIHILMEIARCGGLNLSSLEQEYNKDSMTDSKIDRLISLGLLRSEDDQLYSGNKGYLYYAYLIDFWRSLMGMPTKPKSD